MSWNSYPGQGHHQQQGGYYQAPPPPQQGGWGAPPPPQQQYGWVHAAHLLTIIADSQLRSTTPAVGRCTTPSSTAAVDQRPSHRPTPSFPLRPDRCRVPAAQRVPAPTASAVRQCTQYVTTRASLSIAASLTFAPPCHAEIAARPRDITPKTHWLIRSPPADVAAAVWSPDARPGWGAETILPVLAM
jgi:hypothetical protein